MRMDFELFKSTVCHKVKDLGDIDFIIDLLENREIREFYDKKYYKEAFYLLAMLDYLSRINNIDLCNEYDDLRNQKLKDTVFPTSVKLAEAITKDTTWRKRCLEDAIPEFIKFNIVESEIKNVI